MEGGQQPLFLRLTGNISGLEGWAGWPGVRSAIADGDGRRRERGPGASGHPGSDRGVSEKRPLGQLYQGIANGYDIIRLASLPIKASRGMLLFPYPPMSRRALNAAHCLRALISVVIKVPLWGPQREVATGQAY